MNAPAARYEGLDLFRGLSMFSVVLLHVHVLSGGDPSDVILLVRDFAFPGLIMGSFFVMAVAFDRNPARSFGAIVRARITRLLVPSLVWSYLYWIGWWVVRPWLQGEPAVLPPLSLVLTAYMHLWFLHLVFGVTVMLAPVLGWVARGQLARWPAPSLLQCIERIAPFLAYIPAGLAIGLAHRTIQRWFLADTFRIGTLVAAVVALAVHVSPAAVPFSGEAYAIAVLITILRPLSSLGPLTWARALARWSFVVYILYFAGAVVFAIALKRADIPHTTVTSIGGALMVVVASMAVGSALRRGLPFDWLLPLVPVASEPVSVGPLPR